MDPQTLVFAGLIIAMILWMSFSSKKARARQEAQRQEVVKLGNSVMTTAGFYGTIVDIDGDAITLQSPAGDETVWDRRAIGQLAELPLARVDEDSFDDEDPEETPGNESTPESPASPFSN